MGMAMLKTGFWAEALLRRAETAGAAAYLLRRGDQDAGAVLVKVSKLDGTATLYVPARSSEGERIWIKPLGENVEEARIDAYARERGEDDPDIWLIEIEDRAGRHFLDEPVEDF
jgi:hypothetical protein